jgi:hypothetical protein
VWALAVVVPGVGAAACAVGGGTVELDDARAATEPQTLIAVAPVVARVRSMTADCLEERVGPR